MTLFSLDEIVEAARIVGAVVPKTPVHTWPLLATRLGCKIFVKHENHTPIGAFKVRGGLTYLEGLKHDGTFPEGIVTATRGNHGQSIAIAATRNGIPSVVVVPKGNAKEKNAAMQAYGAELIIAGEDFDESRQTAERISAERSYHLVPPFHRNLVKGVATYAHEFFTDVPDLDVVYAPIGMGSGICGLIEVRDLMGLKTEIVGVVAAGAPAFALSFEAGHRVPTNTARTFADGLACRDVDDQSLSIIGQGASHIVQVSEDDIAHAIRIYFEDTHNVAEGAGAAALAGLIAEQQQNAGKNVGVILSGGNIDKEVFLKVLQGGTPTL